MMEVAAHHPDLWSVVTGNPWIDPETLFAAIEREAAQSDHDFRTRLLLRDALNALSKRWGEVRLRARLSPATQALADQLLTSQDLGEPGFPSLERRMADATRPDTILQFLRELGDGLHSAARMDVGGSSALILTGLLTRATDDIDAVDEVPATVRVEHHLLDELTQRFGLHLAHFQSHYLPEGWDRRVRSLGRFGKLDVFLVDPIDIFVGKLFSKRTKDRDDLRLLEPRLDRQQIIDRLRASTVSLLADANLRADAEKNWQLLFGQSLPA